MNKWIPGLVLVAGAAAGGWYLTQGTELTQSSSTSLKSYVPADTVFYYGGQADPEILEYLQNGYLQPGFERDIELLMNEIDDSEVYPPLKTFIVELLTEATESAQSPSALYQHWGIDAAGAHQIYLDGLVPVAHLSLIPEGDFTRLWVEKAEQSGLVVLTEQVEDQSFNRIRLTEPSNPDPIDLIVAQRESTGVLSLGTPIDQRSELASRLLLTPPEQSLEDTQIVDQLVQRYGFTRHAQAFVDLQAIVASLLGTQQTRLSADVDQLLALLNEPAAFADMDDACRREYVELAGWIPRVVGGYTQVETQPELSLRARSLLEIKEGEALNQLVALNGHIPSHVGDFDNQVAGLGLGLDIDQLMPVVLNLWTQFTQAEFECAELVNLQQQAAATNPAMMGFVTGMAQGIKGIGVSLYDLKLGDISQPIEAIDLLISVATANPQLVINLAASSPLGPIPVPPDGEPYTLELTEIQPGLLAQVALKGQHLTLSTGERASEAANKLASETLDANGLFELSINYPALTDRIRSAPLGELEGVLPMEESLCIEHARFIQLMELYPMSASYRSSFTPEGWDTDLSMKIKPAALIETVDPVGTYEIFDQTWGCPEGTLAGYEEINSDGTGRYVERAEQGACDLFSYEYRWTQTGNRLLFDIHTSQARDRCDQEWETYEPYEAQCLIRSVEGGFDCIYTDDESEGLYRYQRAG